jgi:hypothetical protein
MAVSNTKKRRHVPRKPSHIPDESETDDSMVKDDFGDGSSSGESLSDAPTRAKRQRTSQIVTRSSARNPASSTDVAGTSNLSPLAHDVSGLPHAVVSGDTDICNPISVDTAAVPAGSLYLQPANASEDAIDTDISASKATPPAETQDTLTETEIEVTSLTGAGDPMFTDSDGPAVAETETEVLITAETGSCSPQALLKNIDEASIPSFLLRHGKGKREVNIFNYLQEVEDPHFQQVLSHYLRFEINDKSGMGGSLPTANRPTEISQWTSRARPANLPDYTKAGRTFADYVDSVFTWWSLIQPSWRTFERGRVSRKVLGEWDVLYAPRINGLLNVVMLVYWWIKILEEHKPEDGRHADYVFFAEDVAWVFSKLTD